MSSSHHRRPRRTYTCTLAIESIQVDDGYDCSYFAKWKKGKESGSTEYCLSNADGHVDVRKEFTFDVDPHNKKQNRKITLSVFRYSRKTKKIGKIKIDLMQYINKPGEMMKTVELISTLDTPPRITLSIYATCKADDSNLAQPTNEDLASIIDATQELATMSAIHEVTKIQTNMRKLKPTAAEAPESMPKLSQMVNADAKMFQTSSPMSDASRKQKTNSLILLGNFLSSSGHGTRPSTSTFSMPPLANEKLSPIYDVVSDVLGNFDHLLAQKVEYTDKLCRSFEGPDSFIFAQCIVDDLFLNMSESHFQSVMNSLPAKIIDSPILSTYNDERRRFFPLYGLSALLYRPPSKAEVNTDRTMILFNALQEKTLECLKTVISSYVTLFEVQVKRIIEHKAGNEETIEDINRLLDAYLIACQAPIQFEKILTNAIITAIDIMFMKKLLKMEKITFMDSIPWNSFCTCFRENAQFELKMFSQSVCVIQMASVIDQDNNEIESICEDLTPITVLHVLKRRAVDDTIDQAPDVEKFAKHFGINIESNDFDADKLADWRKMLKKSYKKVDTEQWTDVNVPTQMRLDFPRIQKFFTE